MINWENKRDKIVLLPRKKDITSSHHNSYMTQLGHFLMFKELSVHCEEWRKCPIHGTWSRKDTALTKPP